MKIKLAGPCLCDSRYEGCEHPKPCNGPNSGTGHGPWCAECLPRRFATITASLQAARDLATAYRQLITEHDRLRAQLEDARADVECAKKRCPGCWHCNGEYWDKDLFDDLAELRELREHKAETEAERDQLREELDRLTPATSKATAHRWTRHGHHCCSTTVLPESTRPRAIARCGGPAICRECAIDAAQAHVAGDDDG